MIKGFIFFSPMAIYPGLFSLSRNTLLLQCQVSLWSLHSRYLWLHSLSAVWSMFVGALWVCPYWYHRLSLVWTSPIWCFSELGWKDQAIYKYRNDAYRVIHPCLCILPCVCNFISYQYGWSPCWIGVHTIGSRHRGKPILYFLVQFSLKVFYYFNRWLQIF